MSRKEKLKHKKKCPVFNHINVVHTERKIHSDSLDNNYISLCSNNLYRINVRS